MRAKIALTAVRAWVHCSEDDAAFAPARKPRVGCYKTQRQSSERYGSHLRHRGSEHPAQCWSSSPQSSQDLSELDCVADHPVLAGVAQVLCLPGTCCFAIVIPPFEIAGKGQLPSRLDEP